MSSLLTSSKKTIFFLLFLAFADSKLHAENSDFCGLPNVSTREESAFVFSADFLYWYPSEEVNDIWASVLSIGFDTSALSTPGFNFEWNYGFRLGAGYGLVYDQWDTTFYWTWFRTDTNRSISSQANTIVSPEFDAAFLTGNTVQSMKGNWGLLFNMFDWELGRSYWVSRCLSLRPFLGVKGGWINQSIHVNYYDLTLSGQLFPTNNSGKERLKNNFWGVGSLGGVNTKWNVRTLGCYCLNFFGDFSMATMWGQWACADVFKSTVPQTSSIKTKNSPLGALMFRGFVGIGWGADFCSSQFAARLGFETQLWLNQLRISTFQIQRLHGDLTLQGLTFNCRLDY